MPDHQFEHLPLILRRTGPARLTGELSAPPRRPNPSLNRIVKFVEIRTNDRKYSAVPLFSSKRKRWRMGTKCLFLGTSWEQYSAWRESKSQ